MSINQPQIEKVNVLEAAEFDRKEFVMDQSPVDPEPSLLVLAPQEMICDQDSKGVLTSNNHFQKSDEPSTEVIYGSEELIEIESITEEVVTEEVNDELNEAIESEKPKGPRNPSPEPGTSYETASSSPGEDCRMGATRKSKSSSSGRFRALSPSSDEDKETKSKDKEADGTDKQREARKSKKKRFKMSSSSSSSSEDDNHSKMSSKKADAPAEGDDSSNSSNSSSSSSSNDAFASIESSDQDLDSFFARTAEDDDDPVINLGELGSNVFRFTGGGNSRTGNKPGEKPEVLTKPEAKPKFSFIKDYQKMQLTGYRDTYIRHSMAQLDFVRRFDLSHALKGHSGCVNSIHFNEGGSLLASGSDDLRIFIWDWEKKKKAYSFKSGHTQNVFQSKFLPLSGDAHLVTSSRDGQVRLAVLSSTGVCRSTKKVAQHSRAAHKLALLDSCPHTFISAGEDGLIILVDLREPTPTNLLLMRKQNRPVALYSVHSNPANDYQLCAAGKDSSVHVFDRRIMSNDRPEPIKKFCPASLASDESSMTNITSAVYNHDGTEILASYNDDDIYLFKTNTEDGSQFYKRYQGHLNSATVKGVNFYGPESEFIVSGSDCGHIFFWDKETEGIVRMVSGDKEGVVNCLEPHPNLPVMATSGLDHSVKIWMPTSTKEPDMKKIESVVLSNRRSDRFISGDRMLSVLWRHISWMQHRRRAGRAADDVNPTNEDDTDTGDEDSDEDEDVDLQDLDDADDE